MGASTKSSGVNRRIAVLVVVLVALVAVAACSSGSSLRTSAGAASDSNFPTAAQTRVANIVEAYGGANNLIASYAMGTRGPANQALDMGSGSTDSTPVIAVVVTGDFTVKDAPLSNGQTPPTGKYLEVTLSVANDKVLDYGVSDNSPDLTTLGQVGTVKLPNPGTTTTTSAS